MIRNGCMRRYCAGRFKWNEEPHNQLRNRIRRRKTWSLRTVGIRIPATLELRGFKANFAALRIEISVAQTTWVTSMMLPARTDATTTNSTQTTANNSRRESKDGRRNTYTTTRKLMARNWTQIGINFNPLVLLELDFVPGVLGQN